MLKITSWSVLNKDGSTTYNHIENGWVEGEYPVPLKDDYNRQKVWSRSKWIKEHMYLRDGVIISIDNETL